MGTCSCGRKILVYEIIRKCDICKLVICSECISAKKGLRQTLLCHNCLEKYDGKASIVRVRPELRGKAKTDDSKWSWVLFDSHYGILLFEIDGDKMLACSPHLEKLTILVDKLWEDTFLAMGFHIGRAFIPDDIGYPPLNITYGKRNLVIIGSIKVD